MTVTLPNNFNQQLNQAFLHEFNASNPSSNSVIAGTTSISLQCLHTGVVILTFQNPKKITYRQIPQSRLKELRESIRLNDEVLIQNMCQQIMQDLRTVPETYRLQKYYKFSLGVPEGSYICMKAYFNKMLPAYELDANGVPNTRSKIIDILRDQRHDTSKKIGVVVLVKSSRYRNADILARNYLYYIERYRGKYNDLFVKIQEQKFRFSQQFSSDLQRELANPDSFFKEVIQEIDAFKHLSESAAYWHRIKEGMKAAV